MYLLMIGMAAVILAAFLLPGVMANRNYNEVKAIARMGRYARRYDTLIRRHDGEPFVVVNHHSGFRYMYKGKLVSREALIKGLGPKSQPIIRKVEQEESMRPARPTMLTQLLSRNTKKAG